MPAGHWEQRVVVIHTSCRQCVGQTMLTTRGESSWRPGSALCHMWRISLQVWVTCLETGQDRSSVDEGWLTDCGPPIAGPRPSICSHLNTNRQTHFHLLRGHLETSILETLPHRAIPLHIIGTLWLPVEPFVLHNSVILQPNWHGAFILTRFPALIFLFLLLCGEQTVTLLLTESETC